MKRATLPSSLWLITKHFSSEEGLCTGPPQWSFPHSTRHRGPLLAEFLACLGSPNLEEKRQDRLKLVGLVKAVLREIGSEWRAVTSLSRTAFILQNILYPMEPTPGLGSLELSMVLESPSQKHFGSQLPIGRGGDKPFQNDARMETGALCLWELLICTREGPVQAPLLPEQGADATPHCGT